MNQKILVYPIQYTSRKDIIKIKPIMDIHKGSRTCDMRAFKAFIADRDDKTYFFTNGDLWDAIYFNDKRFKPSGHDKADEDDAIDTEVAEMVEILSPIKDRLICVGHGNHEETILQKCHTNMSKRLADALGVSFQGYSFWIRLLLTQGGNRGRSVDVFSTHGFGGGTRTEGGSITKYAKASDRYDCDIFVAGHDHRKQSVKYPVMSISGEKDVRLRARPKLVVLGGSWKKSYSNDTSATWEETKGFPPSEIGGVTISIKVKNAGVGIDAAD